jgi:DNA-binding NtrC family response regulator
MKNITKQRVLILEDDEMVRLIINDYLIVSGFDAIDAEDPFKALDILKNDPCDVAIVDINIPKMSGEEFITKAKTICPDIQFIIHTGASDYKVSSKMIEMGLSQNNVLVKPVEDMNSFVSIIKQFDKNLDKII